MSNFIFAITDNSALCSLIQNSVDKRYELEIFKDVSSAFYNIFNEFPILIIIEINPERDSMINFINDIKADSLLGQIAILCIIPDDLCITKWDALLVDDYIRYSDTERELSMRIELSLLRIQRIVELNPLTRLPGNISIQKQINRRIEMHEKFSIAYADIDHFKPYNDKYGFSRGDEVIKMLGRLIFNAVRQSQQHNSFIGHIGGDDFIYIMDIELIENTSRIIVEQFDKIISIFYEQADRDKGFIESIDRRGKRSEFDIMTLSIVITHNKTRDFHHYGEISAILAEMKQYAKSIKGSSWMIDKRGT